MSTGVSLSPSTPTNPVSSRKCLPIKSWLFELTEYTWQSPESVQVFYHTPLRESRNSYSIASRRIPFWERRWEYARKSALSMISVVDISLCFNVAWIFHTSHFELVHTFTSSITSSFLGCLCVILCKHVVRERNDTLRQSYAVKYSSSLAIIGSTLNGDWDTEFSISIQACINSSLTGEQISN